MAAGNPVVYVLHGDDEFSIAEFVAGRLAELGDPTIVEMNVARLDGRIHSLDDLVTAVSTLPFLASRRVVILTHPLERIKTPAQQKKLIEILEKVPPTTELVLIEDRLLTQKKDRDHGRIHWLEKWGYAAGEGVQVQAFLVPVGVDLVNWIQGRVKAEGGQITPQAVAALAEQVGPEPRSLEQEVHKLLDYVNYARPVEEDDVQHLTPLTAPVQDFALVNALRAKNSPQALSVLRRELQEKDPIPLFQSIVTQFRQLLLAREILDQGGQEGDVSRLLGLRHPYAVRMLMEHARRFRLSDLEHIHHRLLELDVAMKTGEMEGDLALDVLVMELTAPS